MSDEFDDAAAWQSPQTKSLEGRLAAAVPPTSSDEQQAILYAAAFAAGRSAAQRQTRRWQAAAALLATAALAAWIPWPAGEHRPLGQTHSAQNTPLQPTKKAIVAERSPETEILSSDIASSEWPESELVLDAWQTPNTAAESLTRELADYQSLAPEIRQLSVSSLGRRLEL